MLKTTTKEDNSLLKRITEETSQLFWSELQLFFAKGSAILVDSSLSLVDVAFQVSKDNKSVVEQWMLDAKIKKVPDDIAKELFKKDSKVVAVVVKPWVLVQICDENHASTS